MNESKSPNSDGQTQTKYPVAQPDQTVVFLIRHGQSTANAEARFTLHDEEPLTELGVEQAQARGAALASSGVQLSAIYASPYHRSHHTAEEIAQQLGEQPPAVSMRITRGLRKLRARMEGTRP